MSSIYYFAVACGVVALLYGLYAIRSVFAASAGMSWCGILLWSCFEGPARAQGALARPAAVAR